MIWEIISAIVILAAMIGVPVGNIIVAVLKSENMPK